MHTPSRTNPQPKVAPPTARPRHARDRRGDRTKPVPVRSNAERFQFAGTMLAEHKVAFWLETLSNTMGPADALGAASAQAAKTQEIALRGLIEHPLSSASPSERDFEIYATRGPGRSDPRWKASSEH